MTKTEQYIRENENVLKRENAETKFTVRLHFSKNNTDREMTEEIQKLLLETYISHLKRKGED